LAYRLTTNPSIRFRSENYEKIPLKANPAITVTNFFFTKVLVRINVVGTNVIQGYPYPMQLITKQY